jgi:hypothetical protein
MNNTDKVLKESRILVDSAKDTVAKNLLIAARSNTVSLTEDQLSKLISIVNISLDESYQRALPVFSTSIKKYT